MLPTAWPASLLRGLANRGRSGLRVVKLCLLLAITSIDTVCGGLLHQWQLDGTTADSVGTNHLAWDGTGSASQAYSWASGAGMRNSLAAADLGGSRRLTANLNARGAVADRDGELMPSAVVLGAGMHALNAASRFLLISSGYFQANDHYGMV